MSLPKWQKKCCLIPGSHSWAVSMGSIPSAQVNCGMRNGWIFPKQGLGPTAFPIGKPMGMNCFVGTRFLRGNCWGDVWRACMICWRPQGTGMKVKSARDTIFSRKGKNGQGKSSFWKPVRRSPCRSFCAQNCRHWGRQGHLTASAGLLLANRRTSSIMRNIRKFTVKCFRIRVCLFCIM